MHTFVKNERSGAITADRLEVVYILLDFLTKLLKFESKLEVSDRFLNKSQRYSVFHSVRTPWK